MMHGKNLSSILPSKRIKKRKVKGYIWPRVIHEGIPSWVVLHDSKVVVLKKKKGKKVTRATDALSMALPAEHTAYRVSQ